MPNPMLAFPTRPLHARPPISRWDSIWAYLGALMFAAIIAASAVWVAPALITDWKIRESAVIVPDGHLTDGKCSTKLFVDICDVTLTAPGPRGEIRRDVHYLFVSFTGRFRASVVGDPAHPEWISTDLGLDYFWNRALTLLTAWCLLGGLIWLVVLGRVRAARQNSSWGKLDMIPVALDLVESTRDRKSARWAVQADDGTTHTWTVPRRAAPFVLGPDTRVLGLASRTGQTVMPLDSKLRWVDLTATERQAVLAARG